MIIFDLDGTLADCEHRRHYVDCRIKDVTNWKPNWKKFFEECDKDKPIEPVVRLLQMYCETHEVEVWSGRCESVREITEDWFDSYTYNLVDTHFKLKMRPIGDNTPDDQLKEKWLKEALEKGYQIEAVFDDRKKVVEMWRRNGIFVFDCNQTGQVF